MFIMSTPIDENMKMIVQTLHDNLIETRNEIVRLQKIEMQKRRALDIYVHQSALLLGLDPATVVFDAETAAFVTKGIEVPPSGNEPNRTDKPE